MNLQCTIPVFIKVLPISHTNCWKSSIHFYHLIKSWKLKLSYVQLKILMLHFFTFFSDSCSKQIAKEHGCDQVIKCSKTSYGIIKTNSFSIELSDLRSYLAIFPIISRLNHSCQPNCNHYWSGSQFKGKIQTLFHVFFFCRIN